MRIALAALGYPATLGGVEQVAGARSAWPIAQAVGTVGVIVQRKDLWPRPDRVERADEESGVDSCTSCI